MVSTDSATGSSVSQGNPAQMNHRVGALFDHSASDPAMCIGPCNLEKHAHPAGLKVSLMPAVARHPQRISLAELPMVEGEDILFIKPQSRAYAQAIAE